MKRRRSRSPKKKNKIKGIQSEGGNNKVEIKDRALCSSMGLSLGSAFLEWEWEESSPCPVVMAVVRMVLLVHCAGDLKSRVALPGSH